MQEVRASGDPKRAQMLQELEEAYEVQMGIRFWCFHVFSLWFGAFLVQVGAFGGLILQQGCFWVFGGKLERFVGGRVGILLK